MKEQISALKHQLALADDAFRRFKCNEHAEMLKELRELRTAVNIAREDSKVKDLRVKQLEIEVEDLTNALRSYEEYQESLEVETDKWRRLASVGEDRRMSHETPRDHSPRLTRRPKEDASVEKLNVANRRFQSMLRKLEQSEQARQQLEERYRRLDEDRKKLMMKWQNSVHRSKTDDYLKDKLKALEGALANKDHDRAALEELYHEAEAKLSDLQALRAEEAERLDNLQETVKQMQMQRQMDDDERSLLRRMNQDLTYRAQLQGIETTHYQQEAGQLRGLVERYKTQADRPPYREKELQDSQGSQTLSGILKKLVCETERPMLSVITERRSVTPQRAKSVLGDQSYSSLTRSTQEARGSRTPTRTSRYSPHNRL